MRFFFFAPWIVLLIWSPLNGENCNCGTQTGSASFSNPPKTSLSLFYADTFCGNYVAKGVSIRSSWSGSIVISGIPAGSTVRKAFLYWVVLNPTVPSGSGNFAGNPITGVLVGRDRDPCWGSDSSWVFRYDVTSWVSGNGTYDVSFSGGQYGEGASLVVFYENDAEREQVFLIYNGNIFLASNPKVYQWTMQGFNAEATPEAKITYIIADGQGSGLPDSMFYNGSLVDWNTTEGFDGPYWDTRTYDVSALTPGGSTQANCKYAMGDQSGTWDCVILSACVLAVSNGVCPTGVEENTAPHSIMFDNYPNPFANVAYIRYGVMSKVRVSVKICDLTGRAVRSLVDREMEPGEYVTEWRGENELGKKLPSGIYFVKLHSGNYTAAKKLMKIEWR